MSQLTGAQGNKPGMAERAKAKTAERAGAVIAAALGPQEQIRVGTRVQSGPSQWWVLLSTYVRFLQHYYYMALTGQHVVLCGLSVWTGRPKNVKVATPREQVRVTDYQPGTVFASFRYWIPGRKKPMRMRVGRGWRPEIEALLAELGAVPPEPSQVLSGAVGMPPPAGPVLDMSAGEPPPYDTGPQR